MFPSWGSDLSSLGRHSLRIRISLLTCGDLCWSSTRVRLEDGQHRAHTTALLTKEVISQKEVRQGLMPWDCSSQTPAAHQPLGR